MADERVDPRIRLAVVCWADSPAPGGLAPGPAAGTPPLDLALSRVWHVPRLGLVLQSRLRFHPGSGLVLPAKELFEPRRLFGLWYAASGRSGSSARMSRSRHIGCLRCASNPHECKDH